MEHVDLDPAAADVASKRAGPVRARSEAGAEPLHDPVSRERRPLLGFEVRSRTTIHGWGAMLFGGVFFAVGVLLVLVGLRVIPSPDSSFHVAPWIVAVVGGTMFGLPGLLLMAHGALGIAATARRARRLAERPGEPWMAEHDWDRGGESLTGWGPVSRSLIAGLGMQAFLAPFVLVALDMGSQAWPILAFVSLFELIVVGIFVQAGLRLVRALRYGRTYVRWSQFPARPGSAVDLRFGVTKETERFDQLEFILRCVEEVYETHGSGKNRKQVVVAYSVFEDRRVLADGDVMPVPGRDIAVRFDLPRDAPGTDLASRPPRYWQLEVNGDVRGADYAGRFLVPVYA